jgi:hypothetical protein
MDDYRLASLLSVKLFIRKYPAFTHGGMRHLIFHENTNGLTPAGAIVRVGRKVLIHEERFMAWVLSNNRQK